MIPLIFNEKLKKKKKKSNKPFGFLSGAIQRGHYSTAGVVLRMQEVLLKMIITNMLAYQQKNTTT